MKLSLLIIFLILLPISAKADTISLTKNRSVNGLVTYSLEKFTVESKFKYDENKIYDFERNEVKSIEINKTFINQGPPPPSLYQYEVGGKHGVGATLTTNEGNINIPVPKGKMTIGVRSFPPSNDESTESDNINRPNVLPASPYPDEIWLKDGTLQKGKLISITPKVVKIVLHEKETSFERNEVQSIHVGND